MPDYSTMEEDTLLDLLSAYTIAYSKMMIEGGSDEDFRASKVEIERIQAELESRKGKRLDT